MSDVRYDLQVTHARRSPVFVIGYARSGTSLTCQLLRRFLKVSFGTESQFIVRYHRRLARYGDLHDDANLRRLIKDISAERFFARSNQNWGFVFDPTKGFSETTERSYSGVLDAIFRQLAEHNGMVRWGDKTPQYNEDLSLLRDLFPDAQFVHIVRDGRDVTLSIQRTHFGPKNACETAGQWVRALGTIRAFSRTLSPEQFFELRYEDLTDRPADTIAALGHFLGIDDSSGDLQAYLRRHIAADVRSDNGGKWRRRLPSREVERFEAIAGPMLDRFGYERAFAGAAQPIAAPERLYWTLRGSLSRVVMGGHWWDTWYTLGLHARPLAPGKVTRTATQVPAALGRVSGVKELRQPTAMRAKGGTS